MKINRVHLKNLRIYSDSVLEMGDARFIAIRGKNFSGKTSLAEGLSLALTPTTKGLDGRGAGFARKVKRGETKAIIEVDLQGANRTIRRSVTLSVTASGRQQKSEDLADPSWVSAKFDALLDAKKTALGIAINTQNFQAMIYSGDEKAQKNLLAQLVLPARYEFPKETISDVEAMLGEGVIAFEGEPFAVIEQAYKKLYKEREDFNRRVKEFTIPDSLPRPQGVDSVSLKSQLTSLREARAKWSAERDAASKKASEAAVKQARAKAKADTLEAALKSSKDALRTINEAILPNPSAVEAISANKQKYDQLIFEQKSIQAAQDYAKKDFDRISKISESVGSVCPTCNQEIDEDKVARMAENIVAERNKVADKLKEVSQALISLGDVDGAIDKLAKHKEALASKAEVEAKIEQQEKELEGAKAEASVCGLFDSSVFDTTISETDRTIESILQQIQPVIAAEEREKDIATKKEQLKLLEEKATKLDSLVHYFDKDGIKAKLIGEYIGGFEHKVNAVLSSWNYSCSLSIEPFKFEVTNHRGDTSPIMELSGAEELMFYAAFQCAVSRTAGIGFVVIDRVDTLLPELRPKLYSKLHQMVSEKVLDQVILMVADTSEQVPKIPYSSIFMIEEGKIRRLE